MYKLFSKQIFMTLLGILLISGCSGKSKKDDFDLSGLKIPKKNISLEIEKGKKEENKEVKLKLIPLETREKFSRSIKYGKNNPFSVSDNESNKLIDNFELKGFISLEKKDFALVEYNNQRGIININSVGGVNTKILPMNTFVSDINPSQEKINLSIEGQIYTIKLN